MAWSGHGRTTFFQRDTPIQVNTHKQMHQPHRAYSPRAWLLFVVVPSWLRSCLSCHSSELENTMAQPSFFFSRLHNAKKSVGEALYMYSMPTSMHK